MEIAVATWSCFRELEPGVKWILSDLLDIAAERGNCKESPEGERYLDGIPMEELCHTMIAALNVTKMKHYAAQVQTLTACSRTAAEIVKNGKNGYVFEFDKPETLVDLLEHIESKKLAEMGKKAEEDFQNNYKMERMVEETIHLMMKSR